MSTDKGSETKSHIAEVALALFLEFGYDNVSLSSIAQKSNVSKGGLTYHFDSKTSILEGSITHFFERVTTSDEGRPTPPSSFDEFILDIFKLAPKINEVLFDLTGVPGSHLNYHRLFLDAKNNLEGFDVVQLYYRPAMQGMDMMLQQFKTTNSLQDDVDTELLAFQIMSILEGSYILAFFDETITLEDKLDKMARDFIRRYGK